MSSAAFDGISARIRHWRSRLPQTADLRDTFDYQLLDRFYFVSKADFVIDPATGETNAERTYSCVCPTASGQRDGEFDINGGCRRNDDASGEPIPYDLRYPTNQNCSAQPDPPPFPPGACTLNPPRFDEAAMPSGYVIKSYPILRYDGEGRLVAQFDEQAVVETRHVQNVPVTNNWFGDCDRPAAVTQETYTFLGAGPSQQLVASTAFNDTPVAYRDFAVNVDLRPTRRRYFNQDYVLALDVEEATGFWHRATDVWVRHYNRDGTEDGPPFDTILPTDDVREVSVYTARASRRSVPGLVR
jgi:hypothetical protein